MSSVPTQRKVLMTGASSCIGKTTAIAFAKAGTDLALGRPILPGAVNTPAWDTDPMQAVNFDQTQILTPETVAPTILLAALIPDGAVISGNAQCRRFITANDVYFSLI